jgi:hypothetical protein
VGLECTTCRHGKDVRDAPLRDAQVDALVYELYGSTEEEIAIVEGRDT